MTEHRYPVASLRGDYIRAGIGAVFMGLMLIGASSVPVMFVLVGAVFLMFVGFGIQTWSKHMTMIEFDAEGIRFFGLRRRIITWDELTGVKLRFFTIKKDRDSGWMELTLTYGSKKAKIESIIDGFQDICEVVAKAAEDKGITIDENSVENFNSMGIQTKSPGLPEAAKRFDKMKPWQEDM